MSGADKNDGGSTRGPSMKLGKVVAGVTAAGTSAGAAGSTGVTTASGKDFSIRGVPT